MLGRVVALVFVVSACSGRPAATSSATVSSQVSATPPIAGASPTPIVATATAVLPLRIDDLPRVELATLDATAVCDPDPGQATIDAGESRIACSDGLRLAVAAVRAVTPDRVSRLYLRRPPCAAGRCSEDELSTADVTVWTATEAFTVRLDSRLETVPLPSRTNDDVWPLPGSAAPTASSRPSIARAPRELAHREAYPFCGRAEVGDPPAVLGCFRDAVLAGRKAEMIERLFGIEDGETLWAYRYGGHGRIVRYSHDQTDRGDGTFADSWSRSEGAMVLGTTPLDWDFDPWSSTQL